MKNNKGFTLIELLAVVSILALLVIISLPNIMELFNEAKENSFLTECKQIYKSSEQQWMSDSMFKTEERVYSKCETCTGKQLKLSGRQEIEYYVKVNKAGKIVKFYVTDGTFQYGNEEELKITDITEAQRIAGLGEGDVIKITNNGGDARPFKMVEQAVRGEITRGDEFAIQSEHFYVVSSDANNVVALAKYDLLVGDNVEYVDGHRIYTKVYHGDGYGLQDENIGKALGRQATTGLVAFSGTLYWANGNKLKPEYGSQPYIFPIRDVHIFNMDYSETPYAIDNNVIGSDGVCSNFCNVTNNDYTVAYYVKRYIERLRYMGATTISGRLLYDNEAADMHCSLDNQSYCDTYTTPYWLTSRSFWIDSLFSMGTVRHIESNRTLSTSNYNSISAGVRPVIVIPRRDLKLITSNAYFEEKERIARERQLR